MTPGKLVLVRHGASVWNLDNIFTGWTDVALAEQGVDEAHQAGRKLVDFKFDLAFTSVLKRAIDTLTIILEEIEQINIPITKDEALNERNYGDLQGHNKDEMKKKVGADQVHLWRRSYDIAPPNGESLKDTCDRTIPYLQEKIVPEIQQGKNVIVSAHGNSLRSILMYLEDLKPDEIIHVNIPTGVPYVYEFDENMKVTQKSILNHDISTLDDEKREVQ